MINEKMLELALIDLIITKHLDKIPNKETLNIMNERQNELICEFIESYAVPNAGKPD